MEGKTGFLGSPPPQIEEIRKEKKNAGHLAKVCVVAQPQVIASHLLMLRHYMHIQLERHVADRTARVCLGGGHLNHRLKLCVSAASFSQGAPCQPFVNIYFLTINMVQRLSFKGNGRSFPLAPLARGFSSYLQLLFTSTLEPSQWRRL